MSQAKSGNPKSKKIRIGTRKSPLALWQAQKAEEKLKEFGYETEIIPISSEGDLRLSQPIYELGITGVFTKTLDIALINQEVDVAVHSLKDVPTQLADGLHLAACLPRGSYQDILVYKSEDWAQKEKRIIATGSLRRKAFWLHQFPQDELTDLRGNVQLRIQKLLDNNWDGAIFAYAGLERSEILQSLEKKALKYQVLKDMISAPSQGIVGIVAREDLDLSALTHQSTHQAALAERAFLRRLEGGCTAPIGALAKVKGKEMHFQGAILSLGGEQKVEVEEKFEFSEATQAGTEMAEKALAKGAGDIVEQIKRYI
ncbi:Porphobilinogen deaminase [Candidatus Ornithobacterium hominis]|uniref:Hydroxymethylbilane synthase n=1 Tax=Candidatus Ornithobacterium hominis TaxID=2497989 RepID=A0A383TUX5_9FLAO|nr:hydroxymethylbilane synthase [Candidatus Ornithobacterium hominis]MCT7903692.1 hydroxymethylbilane synthase [Candidatus Ornithobacterium hominis]SZD71030.1 Porphobilinogen deaminase [Candidatus Ornithobacterium hominis]